MLSSADFKNHLALVVCVNFSIKNIKEKENILKVFTVTLALT